MGIWLEKEVKIMEEFYLEEAISKGWLKFY